MAQNITYDDRDSILQYSGGWFRTGTYNATAVGETGTLASSDITSGVNVTFVFPTPATEFFYFGMQRCCGGLYLICIDCDPNDMRFDTINAVAPDDGQNPPVLLYSRKFDEPGIHEVILKNEPDPAFGGNSQITLDRFELTVPDPNAVASASTSTATATSTTPSSSSSTAAVILPQSSSTSLPRYVAPILAGILGGLVILLILVGIWYLLRRRRRRARRSFRNLKPNSEVGSSAQPQSSWRNTAETLATFPATTTTTSSRRETDAGRIQYYDTSPAETLPPEYGQVFDSTRPAPALLPSQSRSVWYEPSHKPQR